MSQEDSKDPGVHPKAIIQGDVVLGEGVQLWPGVVLKAENGRCVIGKDVVILDDVFISSSVIGDGCIISQRAMIVDSVVGHECLIGPGSRILDGARIGNRCVLEKDVTIKGMGFDDSSLIGGDPPGRKEFVDDTQIGLLRNKREQLKEKFTSYGALALLGDQ